MYPVYLQRKHTLMWLSILNEIYTVFLKENFSCNLSKIFLLPNTLCIAPFAYLSNVRQVTAFAIKSA